MKPFVKRTLGHFEVLVRHATREYEPTPEHILKRMVLPLCKDFSEILSQGTKNDTWLVVEGFSKICESIRQG